MLLKTCPVLASLNLRESISFYESIAFEQVYLDDNYLIMKRDDIALHFWKCNDEIHPKNTSCYNYVNDIEHLLKEIEAVKAVHPNGKIRDTEYDIREFAMLDVHGNLIRFGQNLE